MLVCTFLCPFLHDYDVNKQTTTKFSGSLFLNLAMVPSNSTPGGLHLTRGTSVGIIPIKSERTQIHFIRDVLVAVASLDVKVPYVLWGDNDVSLDWWYNIIIYDELPRKKKLARILDKSEISVEPFKLNKCPRASFRSSTVSYFFLFVQMPSTLGTRGFFSRLRRSCLRPSADETKLPDVRENKPLVPRVDATFFIRKCTFIFLASLTNLAN